MSGARLRTPSVSASSCRTISPSCTSSLATICRYSTTIRPGCFRCPRVTSSTSTASSPIRKSIRTTRSAPIPPSCFRSSIVWASTGLPEGRRVERILTFGTRRGGASRQAPHLDLVEQLPQSFGQAIPGAVKPEYGRRTVAAGQKRGARAMPRLAHALLQALGLSDQARRIDRRPGQHDRLLDPKDAGECGSLVVLARVRTEIGSLAVTRFGVGAVNPRHQHGSGEIGIGSLEFPVREEAGEMEGAGLEADCYDGAAIAPEQIDVLVDPGCRGRDILRACGPGMIGRAPIGHGDADHAAPRRKAGGALAHRPISLRPLIRKA